MNKLYYINQKEGYMSDYLAVVRVDNLTGPEVYRTTIPEALDHACMIGFFQSDLSLHYPKKGPAFSSVYFIFQFILAQRPEGKTELDQIKFKVVNHWSEYQDHKGEKVRDEEKKKIVAEGHITRAQFQAGETAHELVDDLIKDFIDIE